MVEDEQGRARAVRASDTERDEALRSLAAHFAEGRLDRAEFDERAGSALEARTRDELRALFADLPMRSPADVARQDADLPAAPRRDAPVRPSRRGPSRRGPIRAGRPPLYPLVPVLLALSVVLVVHGLPPFPLIALLAVVAAGRRNRRWNGGGGRPQR
jgi:hypothetical protein